MTEKIQKLFHVHVNAEPHNDDYSHRPGKRFPCHYRTKQMPADWSGDSGCKYHVNTMHVSENGSSGGVHFGTCSEFRLILHLIGLMLRGYRKSDDRQWSS